MEANTQLRLAPHDMHLALPFPVKGWFDELHIIFPKKLCKYEIDFHESEAGSNISVRACGRLR